MDLRKPEILSGLRLRFYPNGQIRSQDLFAAGLHHGHCKQWRPDGTRMIEAQYWMGLHDGQTRVFSASDVLEQSLIFRKGELVSQTWYDHRGNKKTEKVYR